MSLVKRALGMVPVGKEGEQPLTPEEEEQEAQRRRVVPLAAVGASVGPIARPSEPAAPYEGEGIPMDRRAQMKALKTEGSGRNKLEQGGLLDYDPRMVPVGPAGGEAGGPRDEFSVADADRIEGSSKYFNVEEEAARRGPMGYQRGAPRESVEPVDRFHKDNPNFIQRIGNAVGAGAMALVRGEGLGGAIGAGVLGAQASRKGGGPNDPYGHSGRFGRYGDIMEDEQVAKEAEQRAAEMKPVFQQEEHEAQLDDYAGRAEQRTMQGVIDENEWQLKFEKAASESKEAARKVLGEYAETRLKNKMDVPETLAKAIWGPEATEIKAGEQRPHWAGVANAQGAYIFNTNAEDPSSSVQRLDVPMKQPTVSESQINNEIEAEMRADKSWGDPEDEVPNPDYATWVSTGDAKAMAKADLLTSRETLEWSGEQKDAEKAKRWAALSEAQKDAYRKEAGAPKKTVKKKETPNYTGRYNREFDARRKKRMEATKVPPVDVESKAREQARNMSRTQAEANAAASDDPAAYMAAWESFQNKFQNK